MTIRFIFMFNIFMIVCQICLYVQAKPESILNFSKILGPNSAFTAGSQAKSLCNELSQSFQAPLGVSIQQTFTQYVPQGSNVSIEYLTKSYPNGTIPDGTDVEKIVQDVGPDLNVESQVGYGHFKKNGLPAFCRFMAKMQTSANTSVLSEVWLPLASNPFDLSIKSGNTSSQGLVSSLVSKSKKRNWFSQISSLPGDFILGFNKGWNGRMIVLGNSGQLGFVPMVTMKNYMGRYMFAVAGTNLGHFSDQNAVNWVKNGFEDTLTDFASRANHLTTLLAESVIDQYYGKNNLFAKRNSNDQNRIYRYYAGTSVGGARGLSAAQMYPQDFHGIIVGAPVVNFMNTNVGQLHIASLHNKTFIGSGYFSKSALYGPVREVVLRQCDILDGLQDGIISAPTLCKPELEKELLCGTNTAYGQSNTTCLTQEQIHTIYQLYNATFLDGEQVYPAFWPGLEESASNFKPSNPKASGWHQLVVLRQNELNASFNPFTDIRLSDLKAGNAADPGGVNAAKTDLSPFVNGGGKMIMYQGSYDLTVSPQATIDFFEKVKASTSSALGGGEQINHVTSAIKLYEIFGMKHSRNGPGSVHFGAPQQNDDGQRPYKFESGYDITLAMIAWVEKGIEPNGQIAVRYGTANATSSVNANSTEPDQIPEEKKQDYKYGVIFSRLLCPYPAKAVYQNGKDATGEEGYRAFTCA